MSEVDPLPHQRWLAVLAQCSPERLDEAWRDLQHGLAHSLARPVETGMVLLRGRVSGSGAPFNFGEATVTRAVAQLESGEMGFAYRLGRNRQAAERAAVFHALLQTRTWSELVETRLIRPAEADLEAKSARRRNAAASTRVDFSTLARGDD